MFWMMNGMGPHGGRRMHHGGYHPIGGLFLFPGILLGGFFGLYAMLAVLNIAGVVIGALFSVLGAAFAGIVSGIGSLFSGIDSTSGLIAGIVIGLVGYYLIRSRKIRNAKEE